MQTAVAMQERLKVMLVDDDEMVRDAISEILSRKGCSVSVFDNAEKAVEELVNGGGVYDVLVTDINMPGLNGMDFLQMAREASPDTPVVMITGYPSIDVAVEAMKCGANDFLTKPFRADELELVIRKVVNEARGGEAPRRETAPPKIRAISKMPATARRRLEDKIKELSILHTVAETLDEVNEKEGIFRKTMELGQIISDADRAFIMVVEHENETLVVRAATGYETDVILGRKFSLNEEPFKSVVGKKCYTNVLMESGSLGGLVAVSELSRRVPLILTPIAINREVVVVLGLSGDEKLGEFTGDSMTLLLNLAAKASLKLENIALTENIFTSIIGAINSLLNALDARDTYTKDHSNRVMQYALQIARAHGSAQEVIDSISFAGPLHDVGKIGVRDEVLLKQGSFTAEERELMKSHVVRGEEILRPLNLLDAEKAVVLYHHERWDGEGYPNGLKGGDIPICARIFSVADTFDAMTSTRPYRKALSADVAREEILRCSGTQFDPDVVCAFLESHVLEMNAGEGASPAPEEGRDEQK